MKNLKTFSPLNLYLPFLFLLCALFICVSASGQCPTPSPSSSSGCAGVNTLSASNMSGEVTGHRWYLSPTGGSPISGVNQFSPMSGIWVSQLTTNFTSTTTYYVSAICGFSEGSRVPVTFTVTGGSSINISPSGNPLSVCEGSGFTLTASGGSNYQWKYDTNASGANASFFSSATTITPTQTGYYFLSGTNSCNVTQTSSIPVTISPSLGTPSAPNGTLSRCQGSGTTKYTSSAGGATSYTWAIANAGNSSMDPSSGIVTWDPAFSGTATVTVTASSSNGCGTSTSASQSVSVMPATTFPVNVYGPNQICSNASSVTFTAVVNNNLNNATLGTISYQWYKDDVAIFGAVNSGFTSSISCSVSQGSRLFCIAYSNAGGCVSQSVRSNTYIVNVTSATSASISINVPKIDYCSGEVIPFSVSGANITASSTFLWKRNGLQFATTSTTSLPTSDEPVSGTFYPGSTVTVDVTHLSGTCLTSTTATGTTAVIPIKIHSLPVANVTPNGSLKICSSCSQSATTPASSGYLYQWKKDGANITPGGNVNPFSATAAGSYSVLVTVSATGCKKESSVPLVLSKNIAPIANAGPDQAHILSYDAITINGSGSDGDGTIASYLWRQVSGSPVVISNVNSQSLSFSHLAPGAYVFGLRVTDNFGEQSSEDQVSLTITYPDNNFNWIKETTVLVNGKLTADQVNNASITNGEKSVSWNYYDGLGRTMQSVMVQGSPLAKDVVTPVIYDAMGRQNIKHLPVTVNETNGKYKSNASIIDAATMNYKGIASNFYEDSRPFAETQFESSPLNRPVSLYGAGNEWKLNDKSVKYKYLTNIHGTASSVSAEKIVAWKLSAGLPVRATPLASFVETGGYYSTGQLLVKSTRDEQGNEIREYTNKEGQVILKKVQAAPTITSLNDNTQWALTYYIYDDYGNQTFILQPVLSATILGSDTYTPSVADLDKLAFQYKYDERQRMVEKKFPGADRVYMLYDKLDRLVMTQDSNQRKAANGSQKNEWSFTKYDKLNRPVITGIYTHSSFADRPTMAGLISTTNLFESYGGLAAPTHGYTNLVFPTTNIKVLTVTYYDNYNFRNDFSLSASDALGYVSNDITGQDAAASSNVTGYVTGSKVNILESTNYLWNITYYDQKYRVIQTKAQNHKGGIDRVTNLYDFIKIKQSKSTYAKGVTAYAAHRKFDHDHTGRLTKTWHKFHTEAAFVLLNENKYDESGQLIKKKLHSRDNGTTFAQHIDYSYNIRQWLEKINDTNIPEASDLFSMELKYNKPTAKGGPAQFSGDISEIVWQTAGTDKQSYGYTYDAMHRMLEANYYNQARPQVNGRFTEKIGDKTVTPALPSYDLNGNIRSLVRFGKNTASTYGKIDNLIYTYSNGGNVLTKIDDGIANSDFADGFKDVATAVEYTYDWNGNMIKDDNKGITTISYNHLNLPVQVTKNATTYVVYTYDASGKKLAQQVFGTSPKTTDYLGESIYENDVLQFVTHEEGRIVPDNTAGAPRPWVYEYFLKDHLGNVRVTFSEKKTTTVFKSTLENDSDPAPFKNVTRVNAPSIQNHTAGAGYTYSQLLNGGNNGQVGLAKSFAVKPGDIFDLEVYAKYEAPTSTNANVNTLLAALTSTFSLGTTATGIDGVQAKSAFNGLFAGGGPWITSTRWEDATAPKAYLNYILFDENFVLQDFGFDQISVDAKQVGITPTPHDYLNLHFKVQKKGYLYVYLSNENPVQANVYFDDLKITYNTNIEQVSDYYPFGLTFNTYQRENSVPNQYKFNGKEEQDELALKWLDFGARMYDPLVGRWWVVDPMAQKTNWMSPYNYVQNNPLNRIDPKGLTDFTLNKTTGEVRQAGEANDQPDRILKTDRHGNIKRKGEGFLGSLVRESKRGEAKVAVGGIQQGILRDGANFKNNNNVISVGGEGQPTVAGVRDFALKLSNYVDREMSGYYLANNGEDRTSHVYISRYENNGPQHAQGGLRLDLARPDLVGMVHPTVDWHTHLSRFGDSDRLVPSGLALPGGDMDHKRNQIRNNPNLRFIIITNPSAVDRSAIEIEY